MNLPRSTAVTLGLAALLLLASIAIIGSTLARRGSAQNAEAEPTAEATQFVAIVETPAPTPETPTAASATPPRQASATARTTVTAVASARPSPTAVAAAVLGSGSSKAARGIAGSMAVPFGGALPPPQVAAVVPSALPTPTSFAQPTPTSFPTSTRVPAAPAPPAPAPPSGGGGAPAAPTPTPFPPTPTRTPLPTATATATPIPTPPPLPPVAFPGPGSRNIRYDLAYTQNANLAGAPTEANAYIVTWRTFSANEVAELKNALKMTGPVLPSGENYTVNGPGVLSVNNTLGVIRYTAPSAATLQTFASPTTVTTQATGTPAPVSPAPSAATSPSPAPSSGTAPTAPPTPRPNATTTPAPQPTATALPPLDDDTAIWLVRGWLGRANLLPSGVTEGRVTRPTADQVIVTFHPQDPGSLVLTDPQIKVTLGLDGTVREVYHRWPTGIAQRPAQLRSANVAWADALAGKGYLEVDQTIPGTVADGTTFQGTATVEAVNLGWAFASGNGVNYLVPVFVFEGTVTITTPIPGQPATNQPLRVPFRFYSAATP